MTTQATGAALTNTEKGQLMRWATYASVATAAVLIAAKIVAFLLTDSVSLLSTLLDSLLDAAASLVNLFAVRHALSPADREHRFGHGKAEPLAALGQSAFIAGSAAFLIVQAIGRLITPHPIENTTIGIAIMVVSILATIVLVLFQRHVIRRTGSVAIRADSLHYAGDLIVNAAVIVALILVSSRGWRSVDPIFGIGIAVYIIWTAWRIAASALDMLMDRELPDGERARIRTIALANSAVRAVHDLRTRASGPTIFVQLHLEMDGALTLVQAHEVADSVEVAIRNSYPEAEIIIHQDPSGVPEARPSYR
ncbi:MAG: cation diffusion facilitator family transporter [Dongiaceae bacterium]